MYKLFKNYFFVFFIFITYSQSYSQMGWFQQSSGTSGYISDIRFVNENTGWAVGLDGVLIKTTNSGINWFSQPTGFPINYDFSTVFFLNDLTGWIGGSSAKISPFSSIILKTTNGGTNWIFQDSTSTEAVQFIEFFDGNTGHALGYQGGRIFKTTNGGNNWSKSLLPANQVTTMDFVNVNTGWFATFPGRVYKTTNAGLNWNLTYQNDTMRYSHIMFTDANTGYASGYRPIGAGGNGKIQKTTNGGVNWVFQTSSTSSMNNMILNTCFFLNSNTGWAAGTGNASIIFHTSTGGADWLGQLKDPGTLSINSVYFINSNEGWSAGNDGIIYKTINGGQPMPLLPPVDLNVSLNMGDILLNWSAGSPNQSGYVVQRSLALSGPWIIVDSTNDNSYIDTTGNPSTNYFYRVYAWNFSGNSGYSQPVAIFTLPSAPVLLSPENGAKGTSYSPALLWNQVPSATIYHLILSNDSTFASTVINDSALTNPFYQVPQGILTGQKYYWKVRGKNPSGWGDFSAVWNFTPLATGITQNTTDLPVEFKLYTNYPNPFNPSTKIKFDVPETSFTKITIYNTLGQQVSILVNDELSAGRYEAVFYGRNLSSGMYYYRIDAGEFTEIRKMVLLK